MYLELVNDNGSLLLVNFVHSSQDFEQNPISDVNQFLTSIKGSNFVANLNK